MPVPPTSEWVNFYVIIGSSAAALTGLMFVVIALMAGSGRMPEGAGETFPAFATPTIVHFCAVLLLAALMTTPRHTANTLSLTVTAAALAGLVYVGWVTQVARRQRFYSPEAEDWIWHCILPVIAYASLFISGVLLAGRPVGALYGVGATALLLLFIGIHNAWDSAVWMIARPDGS
jgi:hypothetical protein